MISLRKIFLNLSIRNKFLVSYVAIIMMSVSMVGIFVYKIYESNSRRNAISYSSNLVEQISTNVSYKARDLEDHVLLQVRNFPNLFIEEKGSESSILDYIQQREFGNLAVRLSYSRIKFDEIYIEDKNLRHVYCIGGVIDELKLKDSEVYAFINDNRDMIRKTWGKARWFASKSKHSTIYMCRAIFSEKSTEYQGIIIAGISQEYFESLYANMDETMTGRIALYNNSGELISCDSEIYPMADYFKQYELNKTSFLRNDKYSDDLFMIAGNTSQDGKWRVLSFISENELLKGTVIIKSWIIITCIICLVIALIIAIVMSGNITHNIRLLLKKIRFLERGDFTTAIEPSSYDEIGLLALEFNTMTVKLNELIKKVSKEESEKQQAEYRALEAEYNSLQAQMNPHFLYNALESVNCIAKLHKQEKIYNIITALATLLRGSIKERNRIITLKQELDYTKSYFDIQKVVHGDRIEVIFDIDQEIIDCEVPKLILQPIVENSICHGISGKTGGGLIVVSAYREKNMVIKVSDDGIGMSDEFLKRLFEETEDEDDTQDKHTKVGIRSVNKRIKILYGDEYGLRVSSQTGVGTSVEIMLPYIPYKGGKT